MVDEKKYGHIEIKNVSKRYINLAVRKNDAVDNVSLDINLESLLVLWDRQGAEKQQF